MSFALVRTSAFIVGLTLSNFAFADSDVRLEDWNEALIGHEVENLSREIIKLRHLDGTPKLLRVGLDAEDFRGVASCIKDLLATAPKPLDPSSNSLKLASFDYVMLSDALIIAQLQNLARDLRVSSLELTQANQILDSFIKARRTNCHEEIADTVDPLAKLEQVEKLSLQAQDVILAAKREDNLRTYSLRLSALASLDPSRNYAKAIDYMTKAAEAQHKNKDDEAETLSKIAMATVVGQKADSWDSRHIWHWFSLKVAIHYLENDAQIRAGELAEAKGLLQELLESENEDDYSRIASLLRKTINAHLQSPQGHKDLVLYTNPEKMRVALAKQLTIIKSWLPGVAKNIEKQQTVIQSMQWSYNEAAATTLKDMESTLDRISYELETSDNWNTISAFAQDLDYLQTITIYIAEAYSDRSTSAKQYAEIWNRGLKRLSNGEAFMTAQDYALVRQGLKIERREGISKAWINRKNASVAALSVLLAAEAIAIPFSGGGSAAAMPATLSAITAVSVGTAKAVLITNAGLNIADRTKVGGLSGLANMDTVFDALVILSLSPRPMVGAAPATTLLGKTSQYGLRQLAQLQYSSASLLSVLGPGYGAYLMYNAEQISKNMETEGIIISPAEIRRKGLVQVALGILALKVNSNYYRNGVAQNGNRFSEEIAPGTFTGGTLNNFLSRFRQIKSLKENYTKYPNLYGKISTIGMGVGYLAMDTLLVTEGLIFSYTNLDYNYLNHVESEQPMPDLAESESAVILFGFEPSDYFLYAGAQAPYSNRQEIAKYGKRLFMYHMKNPEQVRSLLDEHQAKHGPIRYLKISTHGRPGRLFTPAVNDSPEAVIDAQGSAWIDQAWLSNHKDWRSWSRRVFAADAHIRLWACLVGTNLDEDEGTGEGTKVGEEFINALGKAWLNKGGKIAASTRILVGLDATVGALSDQMLRESFRSDGIRTTSRISLPIQPLIADSDKEFLETEETSETLQEGDWRSSLANTIESAKTMGKRLVGIFSHWPPVWWTYGVNLEGPFWHTRYRFVEFPATDP